MVEDIHGSKGSAYADNIAYERCIEIGKFELRNLFHFFSYAFVDIEFETQGDEDTWKHNIAKT